MKFYYTKLLALKCATFKRTPGQSSSSRKKSWCGGISRTYLDAQQAVNSEGQQHPDKFEAGVKFSITLQDITQQKLG